MYLLFNIDDDDTKEKEEEEDGEEEEEREEEEKEEEIEKEVEEDNDYDNLYRGSCVLYKLRIIKRICCCFPLVTEKEKHKGNKVSKR